jgi:general secretion pathway protein G
MAMKTRGFTLIELVITVAIVGLLATAAYPMAEMAARRTKEQELRLALREIRDALDAYKAAFDDGRIEQEVGQSGYPPDLDVLASGVEDAKDPDGGMMYFLRQVPRDPFFPDGTAAASRTWGLRSYESPPDAPQPGEDVFDVYSLSTGAGLNGVKYRDW